MRANKGVLAYLGLSFGLAWLLWEAVFRLGLGPGNPLFQLAILPGAFAPAVAALIVRAWVTREGFGDAGWRPNLRRAWRLLPARLALPAGRGADHQRAGHRSGPGRA